MDDIQDQALSSIDVSHVVLAMMEGTEPSCYVAAAMGYALAVDKPVLVYKHSRECVVGMAYSNVGTLAEYISHARGGGVFTSVEEFRAGLVVQEVYFEDGKRIGRA